MPIDSAGDSGHGEGAQTKISTNHEWAMFVEALKAPGDMDRLRIALQDDEPHVDGSESKTE